MKIRILYILLAVIICTTGTAYGQAIVKGSGVLYTNGAPTHSVNVGVDAEIAIDSAAGLWYEYNRDALAWEKAGFRVRHLSISVAPTGAPTDKQSEIVVNDVDSLYQWRAGAWRHLNAGADPSITNEGQLGVGAGGASSSVITSNTSGAVGVTINVAGINTITESTSSNGGSITITATEVDGSTSNELQTYSHAGTTTYTNTLSNGGGSWSITGAGIAVISQTAGAITVTATEVDGSLTNEGQLGVGAGGASSSVITSNTSGATGVTINVGGINTISETTSSNGGQITITATEVDGSTSNELQTYSHAGTTSYTNTLSNGGGSFTINAGGINTISHTAGTVTITATEVDGSTSNELQTYSHAGTTTYTNTLSNGGGSWSITGAGIAVISQTAGAVTVTATEVDGSVTNELQTFSNSSNATSHTLTLSNSGGSIQFVEGSNVTITTTGTASDAVVTIAASGGGGSTNYQTWYDDGVAATQRANANFVSNSDIAFTLTDDGPNTETEVTADIPATAVDFSEIQNVSTGIVAGRSTAGSGSLEQITVSTGLTISGGNLTANDASATNEAWTIDADDADTELISSQTVKFQGAGIAVTDYNPATDVLLITATEVDGSTSNELQTYSHAGTTTYTNTLSNGGGSWSITGAGIAVISQTAGAVTVTATEVDGSLTNEGQLGVGAGGASSSVLTSNTSGATGVTINAAGILSISETTSANGGSITLTATEVDGSTSNELQTYSHSGTTSYTNTLSNGGGSFTINAGGINTISHTAGTLTITATEVDGSTTNELQTYSHAGTTTYTNTLSNGGGSWSITGAGIATISQTGGAITVTATEVDGSTTNEGQLGVGAGGASSSVLTSNTSGATGVTINVAGINTISETTSANGGQITITATEVDGSTTNELQTINNTSNATSHTVTLSNSGGSIQLVEGTNITLTTTGTASDAVVTIAASGGGGGSTNYQTWYDDGAAATQQPNANFVSNSDIAFTLTNDGVNSETEVTADIPATAVDFSEIQNVSTGTLAGRSTAGSGSLEQITVSTGLTISGGNLTANDASATNELQTYSHAGTTTYTNTLSNGGGSWSITGAGIAAISQTGGAITVTATEVDGSLTNEGQLGVGAGGASSSVLTSNTSGATGVTINVSGINTISETTSANGGQITITATEVDGSTTNELQTYSHAGTTSYTNTLSNGGGSFTLQASGIVSISHTAGTVTITATEVDGSTTNELQTYSHSGTTSYTNTLSNGGGSFTINAGGINTISHTAGTLTITATEVDGSTTNEGQLGVGAGGASSSVLTSNTSGATGVTINVAGINTISETTSSNGGQITITATEVDGSTSNELQTYSHSGTTSYTNTLSNGGGSFTINAGGINTISHTAGTLTITATEVDGSTTNELQTINNTSNATSHTVTLSNSGGSVQLVEGAGISLTTTGTSADGVVTIASTVVDQNGIYGGSGSLPTGGSTVTMNSNALRFVTNTSSGTSRDILRFSTPYSSDDAFTNYLVGTSPVDSFHLYNFDGGTVLQTYSGPLSLISEEGVSITATNEISLIADSVQLSNVATKTKFPAVVGINSVGTLSKIVGTTDGDVLKWQSGGWVAGAASGGSGITSLNGLTASTQTFSTGTSGTDFNISSATSTHTFNLPTASATNRGALSSADWSTFNSKVGGSGTSNRLAYWTASGTIAADDDAQFDGLNVGLGGAPISSFKLYVNGAARFDATIVSRGAGTAPASDLAVPQIRLWNTTAATGDTWHLWSKNNGDFGVYSANSTADQLVIANTTGQVQITNSLKIGSVTGTPTTLIGRDGTGQVGTVSIGSGLSLSSGTLSSTASFEVITPSSIGSDQNNYSPTNFSTASLIRLQGDASIRAITGLDASATVKRKTFTAHSSAAFYFPAEHPGSSASNRIAAQNDIFLLPGHSVTFYYDATSSRWRPENDNVIDNSFPKVQYYSYRPGTITAGDLGEFGFSVSGGGIAAQNATSNLPGATEINTSTSTTGTQAIFCPKIVNSSSRFGEAALTAHCEISIPTLSDGTNTYTFQFAVTNGASGTTLAANNTIGIRYSNGINSGKFEGFTRNNAGTESTVDLGTTVSTSTLYHLTIEINKALTEARFYVNGSYSGRVTTNLPTSGTTCGARTIIVKSAGTTSRSVWIHSFVSRNIYN